MIDTFWTVVEEKKFSDGSATATATIKANKALAESAYYSILKNIFAQKRFKVRHKIYFWH